MKYNCIEMNNNKNCLFGDTTGHRECLNITESKLPEDKPCLDCGIYYYWWDLKNEELRIKRLNEVRIAVYD